MKVKTMDGHEIDLKQENLDSFKMRLKGKVLESGDAQYDEIRKVWNDMFDRKPGFIVCCLGTNDVIECIKFVREHDLLLCFKGGGHNIAGLAASDGAFMLDMSLMRGVWVDLLSRCPDDDRQNIEWARNAWDDIKSFSTGGNYINFQTEEEGQNRIEAALGNGFQKLARIKSEWDPQNVFRINKNIKPSLSSMTRI